MQVEILTPEKKLFAGDVYGVQLPGVSGSFEVLEKHAPIVIKRAKTIPTKSQEDSSKCWTTRCRFLLKVQQHSKRPLIIV